jgi:hypothetical protein
MIGERASKVVLPKAVVGLWLLGWWVMLWLGGTGPALGLGLGDRAGQGTLSAAGRGALVGAGLGVGNEAFEIAAEELMKHVGGLPSDLTACEVLERLKNAGLIGGGLGGLGGGAAKALSEMDWRKLLSRFRNSDEAIEVLNAARTTAPRNLNVYENFFEVPITGASRTAHRSSANRHLANELSQNADFAAAFNREFGTDVLQHMQSGKKLLNPRNDKTPGTIVDNR